MPGPSERRGRNAPVGASARKARRIALVWAEFNSEITSEMRDRAARAIDEAGYVADPILMVSGTYDLPFAVDHALSMSGVVGAVAIGVVVTGETRHDEIITHAAAKSLLDVSLARGKPVGLGVTGPGQTYAQAQARVDRAEAAVEAVLRLLGAAARRRAGSHAP